MWFEVGNKIYVHEPTQELVNYCKSELVLNNPEYTKKLTMGLWLGNTPQNFALYEKVGNDLVLPFGCIFDMYRRYYKEYPFKSRIKPVGSVSYQSGINPYAYQEKALQAALGARNGVLVMPCGAGKTNCGLEIIARLGVPALWLTHTQDLLNQSMNRAKSVLGINSASYGTITGGKVNIGSGITFATVQTMSGLDLSQYRDVWGCVIVDEVHRAVGAPAKVMQFYKVLSNLSCRYKFGLTATPKRSDGMHKAMFALIGNVVCEIKREDVVETTCPVKVRTIETDYMPNLDIALCGDGTINYAGLVDDLTHNEQRFGRVCDVLSSLSGATLVLANRVEYLQRLNDRYAGRSVCLSAMGQSKIAKAARKEALRRLNDGEIDCVFATYQLAAEGLDCPNLRYVVFATPEKNERIVEQAAGRVARKYESKDCGFIVDFVDRFGMLLGWRKKRERIYKKMGYEML